MRQSAGPTSRRSGQSYTRPVGSRVCDQCVSDVLYCERHDAYLCPYCNLWQESACGDPGCSYCPGRPEKPGTCAHPQDHVSTES
jgi:hypothetical protein